MTTERLSTHHFNHTISCSRSQRTIANNTRCSSQPIYTTMKSEFGSIVNIITPTADFNADARFTLRTFEDRNDGRDIILRPGETVILGRASKSIHDVSLQPSLTNARFNCPVVSRKHAVIDFDGTSIAIADCGSLHGTAVNGKELVALDKMELHHGDVIRLGTEVQRGDGKIRHGLCRDSGYTNVIPVETHQALYMEFQRLPDFADLKPVRHPGAYAYSSDNYDDGEDDESYLSESDPFSSAHTTPEQIKAVPGSQSRPIDLDVNDKRTTDDAVIFIKKPLTSKADVVPKTVFEEDWPQGIVACVDVELPSDDHDDLESIVEPSEVQMISDSEDDDVSETNQESVPHQENETLQESEQSPELGSDTAAPLITSMPQKVQETKDVTSVQDAAKETFPNHPPARSRYDPVRNSQIEEPSWSAAPDYAASSWQPENAYYFNQPLAESAPSVLPYSMPMDYYTCSLMADSPSSANIGPPKSSEIKTRISITDIVHNPAQAQEPLETTIQGTDLSVEKPASNPGPSDTSATTNKRKAGEMSGGAEETEPVAKKAVVTQDPVSDRVIARLPSRSAHRSRTSRQKVIKKVAASATHVAAGAVLGMVGTVAFLSSSYADQLIQWLS